MGRKKYVNEHFVKVFTELYRNEPNTYLAEKFEVRRQTINDWMQGKNLPDLTTLVKISIDSNVSMDYLLGLSEYNSLDGNYQSASRISGLSETTLRALKEDFNGYGAIMLNRFVESGGLKTLMASLVKGINSATYYKDIDNKDSPTKDDFLRLYAHETGDVLGSFIYDVLKDLANAKIPESMEKRLMDHFNSLTPEQLQARREIWGEHFFEKLFKESGVK